MTKTNELGVLNQTQSSRRVSWLPPQTGHHSQICCSTPDHFMKSALVWGTHIILCGQRPHVPHHTQAVIGYQNHPYCKQALFTQTSDGPKQVHKSLNLEVKREIPKWVREILDPL